jgi:hypothetical protein
MSIIVSTDAAGHRRNVKSCCGRRASSTRSCTLVLLVAYASEARLADAIAKGEADPAAYRVHVPANIDVPRIRRQSRI